MLIELSLSSLVLLIRGDDVPERRLMVPAMSVHCGLEYGRIVSDEVDDHGW